MTKTATFAATSEIQTWVVPAGVSKVTIECFGAAGGGRKDDTDAQRSPGGYAKGDLAVTAGETLWLYVGGAAPHAGNVSSPGGWNGGGAGGTVTPGAGGGGGATDVRQGGTAPANRKIVAAGGGGRGATWSSSGGAGGGTGGASGAGDAIAMGGGGGTQTAGGAGGHGNSGDGSDGALRLGGAGSDSGLGGGGGGGYYGGGGGGGAGGVGGVGGGGGGGSSYIGGVTNASTVTGGGSSLDGSIVITYNVPPNAPALDWVDGTVIPRTTANRLPWQFSDTDPANTQSKFDLRHRPVGATAWTLITEEVPNTFWDAPAGTFSEGDHEWQVRTYDQFGEPGPYSPSAFLTAVTPGPGPTITTPVNGAPVAATQMLGWSITDQDAYQVRVLDENAAVVPGSDTGRVADSSARSHLVTYDANNVTRTTQLRTEDAGLWSDWVEVTNPVSYTPPLAPEVTVSPVPNKGALLVEVTNPTPAGGEPDAAWNDIYVDDGDGFERRAAFIAPNGSWLYPTPISGRNYGGRIRVRTYAANGTWTETTTATSGDPVTGPFQYGGGYA